MRNTQQKRKGSSKFAQLYKSFDIFDEKPGLTVDGEQSYKSMFGATLSIFMFLLVLVYGVNRFLVMKNREDTNNVSSVHAGHFPYEQKVT